MWLVWDSPKHFKDYIDHIEQFVGVRSSDDAVAPSLLNCMPAIGGVLPAKEVEHPVNIGDKSWANSFIPMEFSPNTFYKN